MSIESIRNSGSVYQGSSPVQGTIRESSAVTTEGLQTSADEMQQENASVLENTAAQGQNPAEEEKATASSSEDTGRIVAINLDFFSTSSACAPLDSIRYCSYSCLFSILILISAHTCLISISKAD